MEQTTKKCNKCGEIKGLGEFGVDNKKKDKYNIYCKICVNRKSKMWRKNNLEKVKKWRIANPEKIKELKKNWYINNREKVLEHRKKYYQNNQKKIKKYIQDNRKKIKEYAKEYYQNNKENFKKEKRNNYKINKNGIIDKTKEYNSKYRKLNKDDINKKYREYWAKRQRTDIQYRIKKSIRSMVNQRIKRKSISKDNKPTFSFLPYTVDELIKHLESLFQPWMNWQNYGMGRGKWVIDHIKPDSLFDYKSVEDKEFQKCWALENLQPLEYIENIKKGAKRLHLCYNKRN